MTQRVVNYTYGTGNPVLPDGSIDVRDGIDNLQSLDIFINAPEDTYNQRDGKVVRTVSGMNNELDAQILNMGFTRIGTFAAGATLTNPRQTLLWDIADGGDGQEYGWSGSFLPSGKVVPPGSTPISTGGISVGAWISRFDPDLRTDLNNFIGDLAKPDGASLVGAATYTQIRSYTGNATRIQCVGRSNIFDGGFGYFALDSSDTTSPDNDGTILVDALNRRWKRIVTDGRFSVKWFGAKGDSVSDDSTAIQKAVDYVGSIGGGVAYMPKTAGWYRLATGIKLPSYVTLEGPNSDRFPFNSGAAESSCIEANFSDPMQWIIEPDTRKTNGNRFSYNEIITLSTPFNFTYNCQVKNIFIKSSGAMPYGGIRMHGCPGSIIDNVSVLGTGAGVLINFCFGGSYKFHTLTNYYGAVLWSNANANDCEIYATKLIETPQVVPAEYLMPFMASLEGTTLVNDYKLHTNDHATRAFGLIIGALGGETSSGNTISYTGEKFSGGSFQLFGYGTTFTKYYVEGASGEMVYGMVGAQSRLSVTSMHCYLDDSSGVAFDLGIAVQSNINLTGLLNAHGGYGYGPYNDFSSTVVFDRFFGDGWPMNRRVTYVSGSSEKPATLINSWANTGGLKRPAGYIWRATDHTVSLYGEITGGSPSTIAFVLPVGFRPLYACDFSVVGGSVRVLASGEVVVISGSTLDIGQVSFDAYN